MARRSKRAESRNRYLVRKIAKQRGWNTNHVGRGGDFLEEQEIEDVFEGIGLDGDKPDFLVCSKGAPLIVVECKNELSKIDEAIKQARDYAKEINESGSPFQVKIIVGSAGEEDHGFVFRTEYLTENGWVQLLANGYPLTSFPTHPEAEQAIETSNGRTSVTIPSAADFIEVAIRLSSILRSAKIEPQLRTKVLGAMITAMYWGDIDLREGYELESINELVKAAIEATPNFADIKKTQLIEALRLTSADYLRLAPKVGMIVAYLNSLNIRSVLNTDTDFLGMLYEAFIRYGYDNNSLGIVFTPRHITRYCAEITNIQAGDIVGDLACGSGGFLVAAFDLMIRTSEANNITRDTIKDSIFGFDTNPTVWSLATLNMFFRGDGKSHIDNASCFDESSKELVAGKLDKALLNPPFSQDEEPERDFIDASLNALKPRGMLAAVVKSGIFADSANAQWRHNLLQQHTLVGMISLPGDLFYPTAVDTSIMIVRAHTPHRTTDDVFMAKVWNDGFRKLKGKRVETNGSQLPEIKECFTRFLANEAFSSQLATTISGSSIMAEGAEFCPEQYLPQPKIDDHQLAYAQKEVEHAILATSVEIEGLSDEVLEGFPDFDNTDTLPYDESKPLSFFFEIKAGKSSGESNYADGTCPYISSGDTKNSIIRTVSDVDDEVYPNGAITVTSFGCARVQPWRFMARGNGGSAVRVLIPKFKMTYRELIWFAAQINLQRWRFFYGRMSIASRLKRLTVTSPEEPLIDSSVTISDKIRLLREHYDNILTM